MSILTFFVCPKRSTGPAVALAFGCCLALISTGPAFAETAQPEATSKTTSIAPSAWVYVQLNNGVNLYDATSNGKLTLVNKAPYPVAGEVIGSTGGHFFTNDETMLYSYDVSSTGAITSQVSTTNIDKYTPSSCGFTAISQAFLDHTGTYLFVNVASVNGYTGSPCFLWQSYKKESNGALTYVGDLGGNIGDINALASNDIDAYGVNGQSEGPCAPGGNTFSGYLRNSSGVLEINSKFKHTDPEPNPSPAHSNNDYFPAAVAAAPANRLAVLVAECESAVYTQPLPKYVASYTIDQSTGSIAATTTYKKMPMTLVDTDTPLNSLPPIIMNVSPSGKYLAVAGGGLQLFHFDGAEPVTTLSGLLASDQFFGRLEWDGHDHLYAIGNSKVTEYAVTSTGVTEVTSVPADPISAIGLVVVIR